MSAKSFVYSLLAFISCISVATLSFAGQPGPCTIPDNCGGKYCGSGALKACMFTVSQQVGNAVVTASDVDGYNKANNFCVWNGASITIKGDSTNYPSSYFSLSFGDNHLFGTQPNTYYGTTGPDVSLTKTVNTTNPCSTYLIFHQNRALGGKAYINDPTIIIGNTTVPAHNTGALEKK